MSEIESYAVIYTKTDDTDKVFILVKYSGVTGCQADSQQVVVSCGSKNIGLMAVPYCLWLY